MFTGAMVALVTPFKAGQVDFDKLAELVEFHVSAGTEALVPVGTTGESSTLSHEEHRQVIKHTVEVARRRIKIIAGTGSNSTREALELTTCAAQAGADGALLVSPYYNRPTQEGLYLHFKAVAEALPRLSLVLYNVPSRTGQEIAPETIARLAQIKNIVGLKEAGGNVDTVSTILSLCKITVVSGDDSLTLPMMAVGARGVISVAGNIVPREVKAMVDAVKGNDWEEARRLHYQILPLVRLLFIENNPMGIKTAMRLLGRINGELRAPLCEMRPENVARLDKALADYGLK